MLTCPMCGGETRVIDSQRRPKTVGGKGPVRIVKRRRECLRCAYRANTFEHWENDNPEMIDRDKLEEALRVAKEATNRIMTALAECGLASRPAGPGVSRVSLRRRRRRRP